MGACVICEQDGPLDVIGETDRVWITAPPDAPLPGYVCVIAKLHVEEPYELVGDDRRGFWDDAMRTAEALATFVQPQKMNYEIYGNTVRHLHMHLFPRFEGDPFQGRPIDGASRGYSRTSEQLRRLRHAVDPRVWS
jgi:diadenosine tetraphosphate (Ap4A) HIT family hydrolase